MAKALIIISFGAGLATSHSCRQVDRNEAKAPVSAQSKSETRPIDGDEDINGYLTQKLSGIYADGNVIRPKFFDTADPARTERHLKRGEISNELFNAIVKAYRDSYQWRADGIGGKREIGCTPIDSDLSFDCSSAAASKGPNVSLEVTLDIKSTGDIAAVTFKDRVSLVPVDGVIDMGGSRN